MVGERRNRTYRTIFLSDVHLGTRGCQAEMLLDFLKFNDAERYFLIGDMVDCWRLRKNWYWPQTHNDVVQKLLRKARKGASIIYIPGNHDEVFRDYIGTHFGGIEVKQRAVHETADGRRLLILHGDEFDGVIQNIRWLALLGDWAYVVMLRINRYYNGVRRRLGFDYWSLSAYLKLKVKNAVSYISNYETAVAAEARRCGAQGVVCGHIHHAQMRHIEDVLYVNDGDWVESCTAVVETHDGVLEIIRWADVIASARPKRVRRADAAVEAAA